MTWPSNLDNVQPGARVIVAMSGGVDSSFAAAWLFQSGYDVIGITLQLYNQSQESTKKRACCAGQDIYDARSVANQFGFPHYVLDYESRFNEAVMNNFSDTYLRGGTPLPCVQCNTHIKFPGLLKIVKDLGAQALVTGHYVRRITHQGESQLHKARDSQKDQSYFLFEMTRTQLDFVRFPLGDFHKSQVRNYAQSLGIVIANKPDSQDICFVPSGSYVRVVERMRPGCLEPGEIRDEFGNILGLHPGIIHYTVGQRKGLGLSHTKPLYVLQIDPDKNHVIVGPKESLACHSLALTNVNWLQEEVPSQPEELHVKIRSSQSIATPATIHIHSNKTAVVHLHEPEYGVAPGQACVFYENSRVLGGGWISSHSPNHTSPIKGYD